jgi:hypothetical protein
MSGGAGNIESLIRALERVSHDVRFVCAYPYGSRARADAGSSSDWDVAIFVGERGVPARSRIELDLAGRLEELSGARPIDVRIVDEAPLLVRGRILTEGILLHSIDEKERVRIERDTRTRHFDFKPVAERSFREYVESVAGRERP